jgi:hypothetical protein
MKELSLTVFACVMFINIMLFLFGYYVSWDVVEYAGLTGAISSVIVKLFSDFENENNRDAGTPRL